MLLYEPMLYRLLVNNIHRSFPKFKSTDCMYAQGSALPLLLKTKEGRGMEMEGTSYLGVASKRT